MKKALLYLFLGLSFVACNNEDEGKIEYPINNNYTINLVNYLGNTENIHPKVLYFEKGLWGYEYWMAYTPYPLGATAAENPCIAVSNDGVNWTVPKGLINPLAFPPRNPNDSYNSDTHLLYRDDIGILECWYRPVKLNPIQDAIVRRITTDGVNWSAEETVFDYGTSYNNILSPAIVFEDGKYKMWYCSGAKILYRETTGSTIDKWTFPIILPIDLDTLKAWHLDVINNKLDAYEIIVCAFTPGCDNNSSDLYYIKQHFDGVFSVPIVILKRSEDINAIDYRSIYRSSMVKVKEKYYLYYSSIDNDWHRHMALLCGTDIFNLRKE